ncbi:tripartite motif-containing protein 16-like [Scomber japonicus]|uniref:tripartite motif-containing protein 16-like n=1 Tax=Scomber japonicus TaxID=13676 RepID=UPI0023069CFC|nr:tripartite motif-containing protein 16-like [Scomber japonicus]
MSDSTQKDPQVIFCDVCTDEDRKPARKTCMKCEISMCVQHLQIHLTTPVLIQTHPLTEPMALCGTTKCPQHGKLLEYYCLDDRTCLCVSCAIEGQHRLHNMKTFSTAHKELMEKLSAEQQALLVKTDDENVSLEKWEKSEREKLGRCSVRLIEAVSKLRDTALTSVQSSVSARMVAMKTSKSSMQAAQEEKDTFRFLQMYSQVHQDMEKAKAVDLRKGLEPGSDRDKLVEEMRQGGEKMTEQADQLWCSLLTLVDPENHQELIATSSDLIFDPQNWGPGISLSKDQRKVFYTDKLEQNSSTSSIFHLKSTQSVPNFQRWVISLSEDCDWTVGLCDKKYAKESNNGDVYGLCCKEGNNLSFLTTEYDEVIEASESMQNMQKPNQEKKRSVSLQPINPPGEDVTKIMARPQKVEVVWSFPNSLSFFSRIGQNQRMKIVTVKISSSNWELAPFVRFEGKKSQQSVNKASQSLFGAQPQYQKEWKCSCGMVYSETRDGYNQIGTFYGMSCQNTCSCGQVIGPPPITEVFCELL